MRVSRPFVVATATVCVFAASGFALADGQEASSQSARASVEPYDPGHGAQVQRVSQEIRVALDQAYPVRLAEATEGVAVGNPSIAGVSVQNDRFLFVTGRSYGSTNLVVVGAGGRVLYSGRVVVAPDETDVVMVTRAGATARMECTPLCRPRPDIGDGAESRVVSEQIVSRATAARSGQ